MASFQAKTGWETSRKRENKNYHSDQFQPDPDQRISKKFKKLKNFITTSFQAKTGWERSRKREKLSFRSIPTRLVIENSKKIAKKFKKL